MEIVTGPCALDVNTAVSECGIPVASFWKITYLLSQALQGDLEQGHNFLKTLREKTDRALDYLEEREAGQLREEVDGRLGQLEELTVALRAQHSSLEKCISLSKDFLDKYKAQSHWVTDTQNLLGSAVEPKAELYQKKAQLAKYKVA